MENNRNNSDQTMWEWLAGELEECPEPITTNRQRVLAAIGGAIDPETVKPSVPQEKYMLMFARNLAEMRAELESLRGLRQ